MTAYEDACGHFRRLDRLRHLNAIGRWDQMANMPPQGNEARAQALAELEGLQHEIATSVVLGALLKRACNEPLDEMQSANLREMTRARRGLIRVNADEVSYPAHIILRYEIERPLIEGQIEVEDIPGLWDSGMQQLFGIDTRGNYRDGCMQDVHWAQGLFGYFSTYTLGALYAAQWFASMRRDLSGFDQQIARGELQGLFDWLRERIWSQGSRWETSELVRRASGEALNAAHFRRHLESRYLG